MATHKQPADRAHQATGVEAKALPPPVLDDLPTDLTLTSRRLGGPDHGVGDTTPEWLRRRQVQRQIRPDDGWDTTPVDRVRNDMVAETLTTEQPSLGDFAIAVAPLVVGLILLFLAFGPGDVTLNP